MKKNEFNSDGYIRETNIGRIQYFKHYLTERYPMPSKPPKGLGFVAFEEGMPALYIREDKYSDFLDWATDEKIEEIKLNEVKRLEEAMDEVNEEFEEKFKEATDNE